MSLPLAAGRHLILRVDATPATGAGHAMRMANLAEAWTAAGGRVGYLGQLTIPFVVERFDRLGIARLGESTPAADCLVVDSYDDRTRGEGAALGRFGHRILVDDVGGSVPAGYEMVWNPNAYDARELYPNFGGRVLSGPSYLPIRDDLPVWRGNRDAATVIALGGGATPDRLRDGLAEFAARFPTVSVATTVRQAAPAWRVIEPNSFWSETAAASRLVTAAGSTTWEAAVVGIPTLLLKTAPNQALVYQWGRAQGVPALDALELDPRQLAERLSVLLPAARPVPPLHNGAPNVVAELVRAL
jgi:spore coat polysaccharide biosynthesis predicted glycosyltransferase SpsG